MLPNDKPSQVTRPAASAILIQTKVVAVLRANRAPDYSPVIHALEQGGIRSIELTLSTPRALDELPMLRQRFGEGLEMGVGTVTTADEAAAALDAGAAYIVTPVTEPAVIKTCTDRGVPVYPGGLTPTELHAGWKLGATAVKLFPASTFGPGYLDQLRGPFPEIQVIPSGGIDIGDVPHWIKAGALAVSLGGPLLADAFNGGDLPDLTKRAKRLRSLVKQVLEDQTPPERAGGAR